MRSFLKFFFALMVLSITPTRSVFADPAGFVLHAGIFNASQGEAQHIGIQGLIGNDYSVDHTHATNSLWGLGYYRNAFNRNRVNWLYGVDAYYFTPTVVRGNITQESAYTNLAYRYSLTNYPIYAALKGLVNMADPHQLTFDVGLGPNIIRTTNYRESSLGSGTVLDNGFSGRTSVVLSATAGAGFKINDLVGHMPLEIDYRFFYLGEGKLTKNNDQYQSALKTGNNYANALMLSVAF